MKDAGLTYALIMLGVPALTLAAFVPSMVKTFRSLRRAEDMLDEMRVRHFCRPDHRRNRRKFARQGRTWIP